MGNYINNSKTFQDYMKYVDEQTEEKPSLDSIVTSIIQQFEERAVKGKAKYGVDLDRTDLSLLEWIEHAKQEHMDAILYLEKIKQEINGQEKVF
jgi:methyl coenzyme M reductase subunit D